MAQSPQDRVVLDASAWIAYAKGTVRELDPIVEQAQLLSSSFTLAEIADRYAPDGQDAGPLLSLIVRESEQVTLSHEILDWITSNTLPLDNDSITLATAAVSGASLLSVEGDRIIRKSPDRSSSGRRVGCRGRVVFDASAWAAYFGERDSEVRSLVKREHLYTPSLSLPILAGVQHASGVDPGLALMQVGMASRIGNARPRPLHWEFDVPESERSLAIDMATDFEAGLVIVRDGQIRRQEALGYRPSRRVPMLGGPRHLQMAAELFKDTGPTIVLDASAWLAYQGEAHFDVAELVQGRQILTHIATIAEIASRCWLDEADPEPVLRLIVRCSHVISFEAPITERLAHNDVRHRDDPFAVAMATVYASPLVTAEGGRVIQIDTLEAIEGGRP